MPGQRHIESLSMIPLGTARLLSWGSKIIEGSLEAKFPTIWTDGKAEVGRVREEKRREEKKREDQRRERVRKNMLQVREKVEKSRFTVFSNDLWRTVKWRV